MVLAIIVSGTLILGGCASHYSGGHHPRYRSNGYPRTVLLVATPLTPDFTRACIGTVAFVPGSAVAAALAAGTMAAAGIEEIV